ncbi:related to acid phosphatase [Cephalotrichum gorgonifer]|uniref:Related to acid phosphatase n=1 Tax=Cephalotrichum gorgonifer TaxID=2041049 RepID=A0AAE8SXE8_9PEZI|nr:related to acid phosphatase [Cephalotrichum gorgonifer]
MPALQSGAISTADDGMNMNAGHPLGMEGFDGDAPFDDYSLEAVNGGIPPLPFHNSYDFDAFTTFEDPFSYPARPYDEAAPDPGPLDEPSTPEQLDNKLLGFSAPVLKTPLVDESGQYTEISMTAELYGMFFVAEDVFAGETPGRPLELTCYRRNLWQCSGQISLSRQVSHFIDEGGVRVPVEELAASITAVESIDGKATEIISIPWKSASGAGAEESKVVGSPPNVVLDLSAPQEVDAAGRVTLTVAWKRLQFKHATANNGRRKGLQQHYVVHIDLLARAKGAGESDFVKVAEVHSGPVIVRGRSPRNFDSRKDVPLMGGGQAMGGGEKRMERRGTNASDVSVKADRDAVQQMGQNLRAFHALGKQPGVIEWPQPYSVVSQGPPSTKRVAASPLMGQGRPPIPSWSGKGPHQPGAAPPPTPSAHGVVMGSGSGGGRPASSVPLSLSLSEDERSPSRNSAETSSPQYSKGTGETGRTGPNARQSPVEEVDMLYEYFPLSLDDWLPPVDAIYRPHIVHHTIIPPEVKAAQMRTKARRYFLPE